MTKMDATALKPHLKQVEDTVRSIEYANKDTFDQMMATDNYIEKYLPFEVQKMIGESLKGIIEHLDLSVMDELYKETPEKEKP